jgi:hypothetical protein
LRDNFDLFWNKADRMLRCTGPSMNFTSTTPFKQLRCDAEFWSPRLVAQRAESMAVRKNVPQPSPLLSDCGAMLTAYSDGGCGSAATVLLIGS